MSCSWRATSKRSTALTSLPTGTPRRNALEMSSTLTDKVRRCNDPSTRVIAEAVSLLSSGSTWRQGAETTRSKCGTCGGGGASTPSLPTRTWCPPSASSVSPPLSLLDYLSSSLRFSPFPPSVSLSGFLVACRGWGIGAVGGLRRFNSFKMCCYNWL